MFSLCPNYFFPLCRARAEIDVFCLPLQNRFLKTSLFHWWYNPLGTPALYRSSLMPYLHGFTYSFGHWNKSIGHLIGTCLPYPISLLDIVYSSQNIFYFFHISLYWRIVSFSPEMWWLYFPRMVRKAQQIYSNLLWMVNVGMDC